MHPLPSSSKWVSMPPGPGTEHTSRALLKVLHLLTSTLWPPASFCRDREHQGHHCDLAYPCPLRSPPASYHADPRHPADDGVLLAVCLHHLLREEEIGFVVVPVIIVWDQVGCHKFGVYKQEPATSGGARGHGHCLRTPTPRWGWMPARRTPRPCCPGAFPCSYLAWGMPQPPQGSWSPALAQPGGMEGQRGAVTVE